MADILLEPSIAQWLVLGMLSTHLIQALLSFLRYDVQNTWPRFFFLLKRTNHSSLGIPLNQRRELGPQLTYGLQSPCRYKVFLQEEIEVPEGIRTFQLKDTKEGILTNLEWLHYLIHIATKQGTSCWQEAEQPGSVVSLAFSAGDGTGWPLEGSFYPILFFFNEIGTSENNTG